jgi:uridine kinase
MTEHSQLPIKRLQLIQHVAKHLVALDAPRPLRVAIDGVGASGKTIFGDEMAERIAALGRPVIRASVDGFHRPRSERIRRGADSVEGYYQDSFDHEAIIENILSPLGPGGDGLYREAVFDFRVDREVDSPVREAPAGAILLFDGVFLMRPELNDYWDFRILLDVDFEITTIRAAKRDAELFGSPEVVLERYRTRYVPGQQLYLDRVQPIERADMAFDNNVPATPRILKWPLQAL